ncbi:MAG: HlyC/CorC family transporter [Moraxellaceae bacterium]|nr:HlyC/CorC family transporter [Moraxellaceae bacterium]
MDDSSLSFLFTLLLIFIALSGFFSGSETGIMTVNRYRLKHLAKTGSRRAQRVLDLLAQPDRLIGVILICNNVVNIAASSVATLIGLRLAGDAGVAMAAGALTFVILIFGEVGPKTYAAKHPEGVAYVAAFVLRLLLVVLYPLVWLINIVTNTLFRLNSLAKGDHKLNSDELRTLVQDVFLPKQHRQMLLGVLELDNITVNDIMVPRGEVDGIDIEDDLDVIVKQLRSTQHTRLPVFRSDINDCIGILHIRNATRFLGKPDLTKAEILQYAREPYYVPEGTTLPTQLVHFQKLKRRFGLVVDEYGDVQGIVTLEAILEEIVGEFTTSVNDPHKDILRQPDGSWVIDGSANIREINRTLHWQLPTEGPKTLNGLIVEVLETIPESLLSLRVGNYVIEILQIKDNTVKTARVSVAEKG